MELSERLKKIDEAALKALAPVFADFDRISAENTEKVLRSFANVGLDVCGVNGLRLYGQRQGCA